MAESVDQLLARVALGDQAAFRALYAASASRLLGVAMRLIGDKARAEDALQESFVAIWNQAGKYAAHRAQAMTWMTAIVRNKAIDSLRATPKEMPLTQTNDDGEEVSTKEIKTHLQEVINSENKRKPLTDDALVGLLKEKGYNIARRTIAKYREQLNIPVARLRKEL